MEDYGALSLLPSALALGVALATRRVILALTLGAWAGMTIHRGFNPLAGIFDLLDRGLFAQLGTRSNATVVILICLVSGFVNLIEKSGGMSTFATKAARWLTSRRRTQIANWVGGLAIFFSDSGNALIMGPIFRPLYRRHRICPEKLAFVLHSTSAPVCALVPITSWGVYIMSLIAKASVGENLTRTPLQLWVDAFPFQLYSIITVFSLPLFIWFGREWGPMARRQAVADALAQETQAERDDGADHRESPAWLVTVPLGVLLVAIASFLSYLWITLGQLPNEQLQISLGLSYALAGLTAALLLKLKQGKSLTWAFETFVEGMAKIVPIVIVLLMAWSLGDTCRMLGTGPFVASVFKGSLPPSLLFAMIFVLGVFISMATGSSWGTYAILIPIAMSVAVQLGMSLPVALGAVLSGGMFGDHCSPVSDTTIISAMASGCKVSHHVNTQLPYALMAGTSSLLTFLVAGFVSSPWLLLAAFALQVVIVATVFTLTRPRPGARADETGVGLAGAGS